MEVALWKRAVAEFSGLFLMCSIGLMTVATAITTASYGLFELSMAFAFVIMLIILVVGAVSGGHINPAITIALALYGKFPWREVPVYIAAQISGGVVGSLVLYGLYRGPILAFEEANNIVRGEPGSELTAMIFACFAPNPAIAGANEWAADIISTPTAVLAEAFGTSVLALAVFAMIEQRNAFAPSLRSFAIVIGLVVGFIIMVLAPLTMSGINPARDLGPRIATYMLGWGEVSFPGVGAPWWVWTVGPILGAAVGGAAYAYGLGAFLDRADETPLPAGAEVEGVAAANGNPPSEKPAEV